MNDEKEIMGEKISVNLLSNQRDTVELKFGIDGNDGDILSDTLSNDEPVERIAMVKRKALEIIEVIQSNF